MGSMMQQFIPRDEMPLDPNAMSDDSHGEVVHSLLRTARVDEFSFAKNAKASSQRQTFVPGSNHYRQAWEQSMGREADTSESSEDSFEVFCELRAEARKAATKRSHSR